jgi:hypothetical protein
VRGELRVLPPDSCGRAATKRREAAEIVQKPVESLSLASGTFAVDDQVASES